VTIRARWPTRRLSTSLPHQRPRGWQDDTRGHSNQRVSIGRLTPSRRIDAPLIVGGGLISGALGLGAALLLRSSLDTRSAGPTAAALDDAFSLLYGAALGLAVGSAVVALAARVGPRIVTGLMAGLLGYAAVLEPVLVTSRPSDVSRSESIFTAAFAAILVTPAILLGALVARAIASRRRRPFTSRRANAGNQVGNGE
jgi:hypothetical protein